MEKKSLNWANIRQQYRNQIPINSSRTELITRTYKILNPKKTYRAYTKFGSYKLTRTFPKHKNLWDNAAC